MITFQKRNYLLLTVGIVVTLLIVLGLYGRSLRRYIQQLQTLDIAGQEQRAQALIKAGKFADAQAILTPIIAAEKAAAQPDPQTMEELLSLLAMAEGGAGEYPQAVEAWRQVVAWDQRFPLLPPQIRHQHLNELAILVGEVSPKEGLALTQQLFEQCDLPPKDEACAADATFEAGFILSVQLNRDDEALAWLRRSVLIDPNVPVHGYFLARSEARVAEAKRNYSEATKDLLEEAKRLQESNLQFKPKRLSHIYTQLAKDYAASGQKREARYYDEQALSISKTNQAQ